MSLNFTIQYMGPYGNSEPDGKWIAANRVRDTGYDIRFTYPDTWKFVDYRVFQIHPNEKKTDPVALAVKDVTNPVPPDPPQPPFRPKDGEKEITSDTDYPGPTPDSAIHTKREIMRMHFLDKNSTGGATDWKTLYEAWPDPEPVTGGPPVRYHNPNKPKDSTFEIWGKADKNPIVIRNWQNRGYIKNGIVPAFDIIMRFTDGAGDFVLVDPPVRNER